MADKSNPDNKTKQIPIPQEVNVHVPENMRPGVYANIVSLNASETEVTINFVYFNPSDNPQGTLVSRVVVPRAMLKNMTDLFIDLTEAVGR